jgi:hypothetical protein
MEKVQNPPAKRLRGPAGLDEVVVDGCAFTESVSKREPRPPLFNAKYSVCGHVGPEVLFAVPGGRRLVSAGAERCTCGLGNRPWHLGQFFPGAPKGPAYTGPITPAMWAIIRRHWNP